MDIKQKRYLVNKERVHNVLQHYNVITQLLEIINNTRIKIVGLKITEKYVSVSVSLLTHIEIHDIYYDNVEEGLKFFRDWREYYLGELKDFHSHELVVKEFDGFQFLTLEKIENKTQSEIDKETVNNILSNVEDIVAFVEKVDKMFNLELAKHYKNICKIFSNGSDVLDRGMSVEKATELYNILKEMFGGINELVE